MKRFCASLVGLIIILNTFNAIGQQNLTTNTSNIWSDVNERNIPTSGTRYIVPTKYRINHLDFNSLKTNLQSTQILELTQLSNASFTIKIPLPDGSYKTFKIAETPILEKPLAIKYPDIKTYSGFDSDANGWYLKMDVTPQGFHAMILRPKGQTIFIDPYSFGGGDTEHYISYYRKDYASSVTKTFSCDVIGNSGKSQANSSFKNFGSCELRTYRLAVSATGEYTSFHGGTVANAQAAQVTTMNRVNGVYERDMAITMVFVANNDLLIYTNSGSDPFSNGNPGSMINENQTTVDNVIGNSNYDIGHVFGTNSGGLAGLGVVCNNSNKARGVTGSSAPVGDTFDIDYVAHEMGHQFDANHCFNNSCGGNRNNATAMEPGSASTIMGYAGICNPNVQNFSDDYFHGVNLEEISDFVTGGGHTCPVITPLSNDAPTITSTNGNVTIPASTPFALTANALDTNVADVLTYCWEQMDNDISTQSPVSTSNSGPNFRSIDPLTSPTRYFPNLTDLMAGGPFTWEVLPSVSRSMDFRVTVRDNAIGGSCSDHSDVTVSVDASTGPFLVTYPNTSGIVWSGGSSQTVTWNVAGTDGGGVNCANVDIFLSTDGGLTWTTTLSSNVANDGSQTVIVPNTPTTTALVMVMCSNGSFFDISDNEFEITAFVPAPPVANFQADVTTTCTGEVQFTDLSTNVPTSWLWDFGDGGSSTQQNPLYIYTTAGTYTVQLTATNTYGSNSVTFTSYITITKPAAPTTTGASICGSGSITLTASGSNTLNWYDDSLGTNLLATGTSYTTPTLTTTTSYFVEEEVPGPIQNVGPTSHNGSLYSGNTYNGGIYFNVLSEFTLATVEVYSDQDGDRRITLEDGTGNVIADTTVFISNSGSGTVQTITLNFFIPIGNGYLLTTDQTLNNTNFGYNSPRLQRSNNGVNYTYEIPSVVSLYDSPYGTDYYYYFYNWEIREPGCTSEPAEVIATINDEPIPSINVDNGISCPGSCDGILSASISGGTPSFTYAWSNSQSSSSISGLCAATYNVTVTDGNGCMGNTSTVLSDPPGGSVSLSTTSVDASCGIADGQATVTANSGSAPYTYLWSDPGSQTTPTATGLTAGNYYVTVTDASGCSGIDSVSIFNTLPTINSTVTNITCNGLSDGTATAVPSGGNTPYTYLWDDPGTQTTATATGLTVGTYTVIVTDNQGCIKTDTITISEPTAIALTLSGTDATCAGNDGTATATASGGTGSLTYLWNDTGSQNTSTATGLSAGTFTVTVTDNNNCTSIDSVTISQPQTIGITVSTDSVDCNGGSDGSIIASPSGGNGAYTFLWDDLNTQTTATAIGLSAGNYSVTVTDNNGCSSTANGTIFEPVLLTVSVAAGSITCNGGNDGTASATPSGGSGAYNYNWNSTPTQNTSTATGLVAGSYSVTVTDANSCTVTESTSITDPAPIVLSTSTTDATCGNTDGSASVSIISGGSGPFTYSWSNGASSSTASSLLAGTYDITVTDSDNCSSSGSASVSDIGAPSVTATGNDANCNGGNDGSASVSATGGNLPYTYLWSNGASTSSISGLTANTYSISVTDALGCTGSDNIIIDEPAALVITPTTVDASCGNSDGSASVYVSGGSGSYTYSWNSGQTSSSISGLSTGNYSVTITDGNNCTSNTSISISTTSGPSITIQTTDASCGISNGIAIASSTGGSSPLTYSWSNGQTGNTLTGLAAGQYTVTVTDASSCTDYINFTIIDTGSPIITLSTTNATCIGYSNGAIATSVIGGSAPYTYLWDNTGGSTSSVISGIGAGTYNVIVTDLYGCQTTASTTIIEQSILSTTLTTNDVTCFGSCNGNASVSIAGGNGTYTYSWNDPGNQSSAIATGLCSGNYSVTIEDSLGCQTSESITIGEPSELTVSVSTNDGSCGAANGLATTTVIGGNSPYVYIWNHDLSNSSSIATGLSTGAYTVLITDNNNCPITEVFSIDNGVGMEITITGSTITCSEPNGSSEITSIGGTAPYTYQWSNGSTTQEITGLIEGEYQVTVTDANNCYRNEIITIENDGEDCFHIPTGFTPNFDGTNDTWNIKGVDNYPDMTVEVFNRWGTLLFSSKGYKEQWDGTYKGKELPSAVYYYIITLNEEINHSGSLTIFR